MNVLFAMNKLEELKKSNPVVAGQQLYNALGCTVCHGDIGEGAGRGPQLTNLLNSSVNLTGGMTVKADEDYLRESILNPQAKVVVGYQTIMPSFKGQLSDEQLSLIISYIKSLTSDSASQISNSTVPNNAISNTPSNAETNLFRANLTREEFEKNKEQYKQSAIESGSKIGSGADDLWIWAKLRSELEAVDDLNDRTIRIDVDNSSLALKIPLAINVNQRRKIYQTINDAIRRNNLKIASGPNYSPAE
jgi:mono/diheme cytochrome c family protein